MSPGVGIGIGLGIGPHRRPARTQFFEYSGTPGSYLGLSHYAALAVAGDLEIVVDWAPDDWTSGGNQTVINKLGSQGILLYLTGSGGMRLFWHDGSTTQNAESNAQLSYADGVRAQIKATLTKDNGSSQNETRFWHRGTPDDAWVQLGSTITKAGATSIAIDSTAMQVAHRGGAYFSGDLYSVQIRDGIDGALAMDVQADSAKSGQSTFAESSPNAQTVTIVGSLPIGT